MHKKEHIIVNATALDRSGALSILKQFIENIPVDKNNWLVFIPENVELSTIKPNVRLEPIVGVKPMHKRLLWDAFGLNKWLKMHEIEPIACVSLQNTGFRVAKKGIPHFIYYHQSLPFFDFKWNPFKRGERTFWFYKHVYPFFVKLFLHRDTKVFVQLDFIKKGFAKRFKHGEQFIEVYAPSVATPSSVEQTSKASSNELSLLYPATGYFYKNHRVVADALSMVPGDIRVAFTTDRLSDCRSDSRIEFIGVQPYERLCSMYRTYDALVFPSYIETYGLPLLEAAMTGLPIIAADLPYAREVLAGYEGAVFVPYDQPEAWAIAINSLIKGKRYKPFDVSARPSWADLFSDLTKNL